MIARSAGILMHLSSLPSPFGIGDTGPAAHAFAGSLAATGARCWQILPLNPPDPENGESPYFSASAFAMSPLLASPELMADDGLIDRGDIAAPPSFPHGMIDYTGVREYKATLFDRAFKRFVQSAALNDFERFCEKERWWLDDYCLFAALKRAHGNAAWSTWPAALRDRHPGELQKAAVRYAREIERGRFAQWVVFSQWSRLRRLCARKKITIIGDLPIYVSRESADVWTHPHLFKLDGGRRPIAVSGVPPDYFSATGQLWNNPVYDWEAMQGDGFSWWERRMAATFERFDMVRIDHFRGLVQYWEVPAGETTAINGSWQNVPTREFLDTMTGKIPGFPVIAEDLGIITPDVVAIMRHYGFPGMKVLQFAFGEDSPDHPYLPHTYEENCVAYTGTHDNLPLCAWIEQAAAPDERERLSRHLGREMTAELAVWECIGRLMQSKAGLVVVPLQDLLCLGAEARMNDPAKTTENWQWRCTPEQFKKIPWERLKRIIEQSGRTV
jgi:4-alpha-glucanotransferase